MRKPRPHKPQHTRVAEKTGFESRCASIECYFCWLGWKHGKLVDDLLLNYGLNLCGQEDGFACSFSVLPKINVDIQGRRGGGAGMLRIRALNLFQFGLFMRFIPANRGQHRLGFELPESQRNEVLPV